MSANVSNIQTFKHSNQPQTSDLKPQTSNFSQLQTSDIKHQTPKCTAMIVTKVCIIGAGPAGATAALQLAYRGIPCVIVDKAFFPRDKVCGDGLSGKVLTVLSRI